MELRLRTEAGNTSLAVRGYFHEPRLRPTQTVLAKVHVKDVSSGDKATIRELQNLEIDEASDRLVRCAADYWGLDRGGRRISGSP